MEVGQNVEVHLNSVVGLTNPKTMKMEGNIQELKVVVLIDSGATHNFISKDIVDKLQLSVERTREYNITMGTRSIIKGEGICRGIKVEIQV